MSSQNDFRKQCGRGTVVPTVDSRTFSQRVWSVANRKRPALLFLCLAALAIWSPRGAPSQTQDSPRKIVSDDFVKGRKQRVARAPIGRVASKPRRTYRLVSNSAGRRRTPARNLMQLGVTIWRLRSPRDQDSDRRALIREKGKVGVWAAERVESEGTLREGEYVRISVESPSRGYLYVIDRELFADGSTGEPMLIFPWSGADNRLTPGRLIDIPSEEDDPNYFTAQLTGASQTGEVLTLIVTTAPLDVGVSDKPVRIAPKELSRWQTLWGGVTERYEMEGGAGEIWTREEKQAAAKEGRRHLTRDDPVPQTIYRVFNRSNKGMLVNLRLKYGH